MKHKQALKQLIKSLVIGGGALLVFSILYIFTSSYREELDQSIASKNGDLLALKGNYSLIDKRVNEVNQASRFYNEFRDSTSSKIENFRRDNANRILAEIGESLGIEQLFLAMGQFKEVGGAFKRETVGLYSTEMTLQFLAFTDVTVFNLLKSIELKFPGSIKIQKFSIRREPFQEAVLVELSEDRRKGVVAGDVTFIWSGIQENEKEPEAVSGPRNDINPNTVPNTTPGASPNPAGGVNEPAI